MGTFYHFHVTAMSSAGTVVSPDQTFQVGPGDWTPFFRCPVDDPTMLGADGASELDICLASNSTHGSITIGAITTLTGNTNLQTGLVLIQATSVFTIVSPVGGAVISDPTPAAGGITAIVSSAGDPSNFSLGAGLGTGQPIITLPIKIQLVGAGLGPSCFIGTAQNPIVLMPENTSLAGASFAFSAFDPDGTPDPNGTITGIFITGATQGDDVFSVPGASGCTDDNQVNALLGLPSPSGANHLVLQDASSSLAIPTATPTQNGAEWAADWHTAFGPLVARSLAAGWGAAPHPASTLLPQQEQCGSPPTGGDPQSFWGTWRGGGGRGGRSSVERSRQCETAAVRTSDAGECRREISLDDDQRGD